MVNMYKLTNLQQRILRALFKEAGRELNQRQIANRLNVTPPAVTKALKALEGLINVSKDKETKRLSITLNTQNHEIMQLKRVDNLLQIYESGLCDLLEKELPGSTIILFGSYSRGEDTINSDIDIAIIGRKEKDINLSKYEKELERKINLNFYSTFNIHKHLKENLANGILLIGGFEL